MFEDMYSIIDPNTKDIRGLQQAYEAARSSDHSTQVGAAVGACFGHNKRISDVRIHAEVHALILNAKAGVSVEGHTMYAPWASCKECAVAIVTAGIGRVVVHHERMLLTPVHWLNSVTEGLDILNSEGVEVQALSREFNTTICVGGEEVTL